MGTETESTTYVIQFTKNLTVKLNNPLMGTETVSPPLFVFSNHISTLN